MRTVEEIKKDIASCDAGAGTDSLWRRSLRCELYETILGDISPNRLEAICAAERDGRLVTIPCKVGDTVYFVAEGEVRSTTLLAIKANVSDPEYAGNPTIIFEGYFQLGSHIFCWVLGERLYLTYAEAEAVLKWSNSTTLESEAKNA